MDKHGQKQALRMTAALLGVLGTTAVLAGTPEFRRRNHVEAVALDEVVLVTKTSRVLASADHNTLPLSGTLFGMLGGMLGQDSGSASGSSNPDVIIASAVGDDGGDIQATVFTPDFLGSLFALTE